MSSKRVKAGWFFMTSRYSVTTVIGNWSIGILCIQIQWNIFFTFSISTRTQVKQVSYMLCNFVYMQIDYQPVCKGLNGFVVTVIKGGNQHSNEVALPGTKSTP